MVEYILRNSASAKGAPFMQYFVAKHRVDLIRLGGGVLLSLAVVVLSLTVLPTYAPSEFGIAPIVIFGLPWMLISILTVVHDDHDTSDRLGYIGVTTFGAAVVGATVGSSLGLGLANDPAYGWFLAIVAASLAVIGTGIGFTIPGSDKLEGLQASWPITRSH